MEILLFFGITLVSLIFIIILRREYEEYAVLLSALVGVVILLRLIGRLTELIQVFIYLAQKARVQPDYLATIFKVLGVAYLSGFGAQICKDAGESALGLRLELAGKIIILFMAVPVMVAIFEMVLRLF